MMIVDLQNKYSSDYLYFLTKSDVKNIDAEKYGPISYRIKLSRPDEFKTKLNEIMDSSMEVESIGRKKLNLQEIFVKLVTDEQ